jgi:hypothetical protein
MGMFLVPSTAVNGQGSRQRGGRLLMNKLLKQ